MVDIFLRMFTPRSDRLSYLVYLWLAGSAALACATWACFALQLTLVTTAFVYLVIIVLLSLLDSFISSAIFSAIAIACLNYFFVEPRFTFQVNYANDVIALVAFLLTAFVVTGLVRRERDAAALHGERARLLDITQDAIIVRDSNEVITYWNRGAEQMFGWGRHEALGRNKRELLRPTFPVSFEDARATLLRTGRWEGELLLTRRDGRQLNVESRWSLERGVDGEPIATLETNHDITERKQAQQESQRNQVAIDALPALVSRYSAEGRREFMNERARTFHGVSVAQVEEDRPWIAIHPEDLPPAERAWRQSLATGAPFEMEMRFRQADGTYRWQLNRRLAYRDASGRIVSWYGVAVDIEDQKRAEEALRRSEAYLTEAQQLSRTGSFGWNTATAELFWSDETFRIFGYEPHIAPSIDLVLARVHPDDVAQVAKVIEQATTQEEAFDFEHRLLMPDGAVKHLHVVAHAGRNGHDRPHFVGAVMDVTARKQAFAKLEASEQRYRLLFHNMPIPLLQISSRGLGSAVAELRNQGLTDFAAYLRDHPEFAQRAVANATIDAANKSAVRIFGARDAQELLGPFPPLWKNSPETLERILAARFRGDETYQEDTKLTAIDGRVLEGQYMTAFAPTVNGTGVALSAFVDATDRNAAQAKLQQVQADFAHAARVSMLGELTASIAHEVNQPLAAIATNGEAGLRWLARPEPDVAEVRDLTKRIVIDAQRAADVISRIRAMATRRVPEPAPLPLDEVVREAVVFLRHEVQSRGVTVTHYPAAAAPRVLADRTQLQQVIVNLAVNAMQAMAQSTSGARRIVIRTAVDGDSVRCAVEDSGPGIAPDHLGRLFDSFFTTKDGGMGMGLPICRSIIEAHGGRIFAENGESGGARFSVTLPAVE